MSGIVSYDLFKTKLGTNDYGFTPEGGIYQTFINNTGISKKGTIVVASTTVSNAVDIAPANSTMPIGVIYEEGIENGFNVKVVTSGKAEVLLKDGEAANNGHWCGVSDAAGRMYQLIDVLDSDYLKEIGHSIEQKDSGTNVLSLIQLHFN